MSEERDLLAKHGIDPENPGWGTAFLVRFDAPGRILRVEAIFPRRSIHMLIRTREGQAYETEPSLDRAPFDGWAYEETFEAAKRVAARHLTAVIGHASRKLRELESAELVP
jgi:hypothetical protein